MPKEIINMESGVRAQDFIDKALRNRKLPTDKIIEDARRQILEKTNIDAHSLLSESQQSLVSFIADLQEERYFDQRSAFRGSDGGGRVLNKEYVKKKIGEFLEKERGNYLRIAIDVEGLKPINDILGHEKGDEYLKAVFEALREAVLDVKNMYATLFPKVDINSELEFVITAEGGDEFGVLVVGRDKRLDGVEPKIILNEALAPVYVDEFGKEKGLDRINEAIISRFHDEMAKRIEGEAGIIDSEQIRNGLIDVEHRSRDKVLRMLDSLRNTGSENNPILKRLIDSVGEARLAAEIEAQPEITKDGKKRSDFERKIEALITITERDSEARKLEIIEKFKNYKFWSSASTGSVFSDGGWFDEGEYSEVLNDVYRKDGNKFNDDELEQKAQLEYFLKKSDDVMYEAKTEFKAEMQEVPEGPGWENFPLHLEILARSDQYRKLEIEYRAIKDEFKKTKNELNSIKIALKECQEGK